MENWKPILDYEGYYEVSDMGRVRRIGFDRLGRSRGTMLRFGSRRGYAGATLSRDAKVKTFGVHRIVWESHVGPIPCGQQINHKNGNKVDNRLVNLEVVSPSENTRHAYRVLGLPGRKNPLPGERNGRARLTNDQCREVVALYGTGLSQQKVAEMFGVAQTTISRVLLRKRHY